MKKIHDFHELPNFSLVLGGPLFQLLMRLGLTTPALDLLKKRIIFITAFAWVPLLLLSIVDNKAWWGVKQPFLFDLEAQARFLVALPLLIFAEYLVHIRLHIIVGQFIDRGVITERVLPRFMQLIDSAMKLRNSVAFEVVLFLFVFIGGHYLWNILSITEKLAAASGSWYGISDATGTHLTPAGYWYFFISRPLFQFILIRWYFRLFIWVRFLWHTSGLELNLMPAHPDRACGLAFLALSTTAFLPLIAAHGVLLGGLIANSIFYTGDKFTDFILLIIIVLVGLHVLVLGPLLVFSPKLLHAKVAGLREYGVLASRYVSEFDFKWIRGRATENEPFLGSSDIQSLADIGNSYQIIHDIQPFPFGKDAVLEIIVFTLLPVLPLVLTMIPLEELIKKFFEAIL